MVKLVDFGLSKDCLLHFQQHHLQSLKFSSSGRTLAAVPQGPRRPFWEPNTTGAGESVESSV